MPPTPFAERKENLCTFFFSSNGVKIWDVMGQKMNRSIFSYAFFAAIILLTSAPAAFSQNTIAVSGYGAFNKTTAGNGMQQQQANQAGGLVEFNHISGHMIGFEVAYSFNRANTTYSPDWSKSLRDAYPLGCPTDDGCSRTTVSANAHQFAVAWTLVCPAKTVPVLLRETGMEERFNG